MSKAEAVLNPVYIFENGPTEKQSNKNVARLRRSHSGQTCTAGKPWPRSLFGGFPED